MPKYKFPLFTPYINNDEKKVVVDCLNSNWISSKGKYIDKFEKKFSNYVNSKYCVSVNNGTAALHLAILALDIGPGDEVIVPSFTYIAPVNAIRYAGAKVKFVDSNFSTAQIDENDLIKKINKKTKAIIVVHLYGYICNIPKVKKICDNKKIYLIEDCAESFGSFYKGKHSGTFGQIGTFSFFGSKTITTGEGGMVVTDDKKLAKKIFKLKTVGVVKKKNNYWHDMIGYNYRMTNICAAIGLAQLNKKNEILKKKEKVFKIYKKNLKNLPLRFIEITKNSKSSHWQIVIFVKNLKIRNALSKFLESKKIETRTSFPPVHTMPMYKLKQNIVLKKARILSETGICLPSSPSLKEKDIKYICEQIEKKLNKN